MRTNPDIIISHGHNSNSAKKDQLLAVLDRTRIELAGFQPYRPIYLNHLLVVDNTKKRVMQMMENELNRHRYATQKEMSDYCFLADKYPEYVSKDQFYRIAHISKKTAKYYLDNGFIPCKASKKKTRRYTIAIGDVIAFMEDRDKTPEKYFLPKHYNNPFLSGEIRQKNRKPRNGNYKNEYKLKKYEDVKNYQHYLEQQFHDYPDMLTGKQIRQVTGHSISVILSWCKDKKVKCARFRNAYLLQKQSVIDYLYDREKGIC